MNIRPEVFTRIRIIYGAIATAIFIMGVVCGIYLLQPVRQRVNQSALSRLRLNSPSLKYTNPLLLTDNGDKQQFSEYKPLEKSITDYISNAKAAGSLLNMGVYYRDLSDGSWTGINEDTSFSPGSLQKVPLMIAYFKLAETDPAVLTKELPDNLPGDDNSIQTIKPSKYISTGQAASVLDLIKLMIGFSDNNATNVLFNYIDHNSLKEVFSDLGISFNENNTRSDYISTKQFSLFFRVLYNSSYLDWYNSEQAMALLAQSDFRDGLVAGVPNQIAVAHKFGESYDQNDAVTGLKQEQLHDCGVIYYPKHPYVLCIMTKGDGSIQSLERSIQDVSRVVFEDVDKRYHNRH